MPKKISPEEFDALVEHLRHLEDSTLQYKRGEYAATDDRLENFRVVGQFLNFRMSVVAVTYLLKHIQSIASQVRSGVYCWDMLTPEGTEGLKQRVVDALNYLYLLAACLEEEQRTIMPQDAPSK